MSEVQSSEQEPVVIKKYANRRLYNTATSSYVTLENLSQMVRNGSDFVVYDAKTGEDITRSVLTQIIVEEEQKGQNLLPIGFLRQLIGFYGNNMQWLVPRYLDYTMKAFSHNQEQLRQSFTGGLGQLFPFGPLEEMGKQNMALFERTMKMFSPFGPEGEQAGKAEQPAKTDEASAPSNASIDALAQQLNALQSQIEALARDRDHKS
ncbi:MAG TPA: polyhydroxyalkanoate synthesis repressor PhaR [Stellaceae bacterium]|nr:polyhydroxyalkanoate synthesis repressor PhaR [Stellaceae bacterium]